VKIQDGCEQSCAYCIVPKARGREWSRDADEIIEEIKGLREKGFKEVVLTGVHIGKYFQNKLNLMGLLEKILSHTEIERVRLSSVEPKELDEEIVKLSSREKRLCHHLHIPLQSGSDEILQKMKRNYTAGEYDTLIREIQREIEDVTLGADVMAGFPGEKEKDFEKTCELIRSLPLAYLHVFSYSDRRETLASRMPGKIPPQTIKIRSKILHQIGKEKWEKHLDSYVGKQMEILVESSREKNTGKLVGLTGNYLRVLITGNEDLKNKILKAEIVKREGKYLLGEMANE
jgi:threonylcarbamoyladenosine tRNA methylthiotransferase MtaB